MSGIFFLVVVAFVTSLVDALVLGGGFLVSQDWRDHRGLFTAGVLFVALIVWLMVLRAGRQNESARTDEAVVEVRNGNWFIAPLVALVMLLVTSAVLLGHTLPKYAHEFDRQHRDSVPFIIASAPGPERNGCRPAKASNPAFGDVTLCLPTTLASGLVADSTVYVSGERTSFGLAPQMYALNAPKAPPAPTATQVPGIDPALTSTTESVGFNVNDILKELGVDSPTPTMEPPPAPEPAPTTILVPELRLGKDKNR